MEKKMMTLAVMNRKGGVGKTTTAVNLAWWLATEQKKAVLLLDMDGQGNAASLLMGEDVSCLYGMGEMLREVDTAVDERLGRYCSPAKPELRRLVPYKEVGVLDIIPPGDLLGAAEELQSTQVLEQLMHSSRAQWDFCVIDCPPSFDMAVLNALRAADGVLIPTTSAASSLDGAKTIIKELRAGENLLGRKCIRLMPNMVRSQSFTREWLAVVDFAKEMGLEKGLLRCVRYSPKVPAADLQRELLAVYSDFCNPSKFYRETAKEMLRKEWWQA